VWPVRYRCPLHTTLIGHAHPAGWDDPLLGDGMRERLREGLRQLGFQVDWVRDGDAAQRELRTGSFAAAVLDLELARQDGLAVLAAVGRAGS